MAQQTAVQADAEATEFANALQDAEDMLLDGVEVPQVMAALEAEWRGSSYIDPTGAQMWREVEGLARRLA